MSHRNTTTASQRAADREATKRKQKADAAVVAATLEGIDRWREGADPELVMQRINSVVQCAKGGRA